MSDWPGGSRRREDGITIPMIWVASALSLLLHALALWVLLPYVDMTKSARGDSRERISVSLAPSASPPPAASTAPKQVPGKAPRAAPAAPVIELERRTPAALSVPPVEASPPPASDLAAFVEARRRARAESTPLPFRGQTADAPPLEDDKARSERIVAENLDANRVPTFGSDPRKGGGVFVIQQLGFDRAEILFYGWNRNIRRNALQPIEVRKGSNGDIRIAVVRRIIEIIRESKQEDFIWESRRLGRNVRQSARLEDTAQLEDFLMRDFFDDPRFVR